jgi:hypothetical protein
MTELAVDVYARVTKPRGTSCRNVDRVGIAGPPVVGSMYSIFNPWHSSQSSRRRKRSSVS